MVTSYSHSTSSASSTSCATPLTPTHSHNLPTSSPELLRQYSSALKERMRAGLAVAMNDLRHDKFPASSSRRPSLDSVYGAVAPDEDPIDRHVRLYLTPRQKDFQSRHRKSTATVDPEPAEEVLIRDLRDSRSESFKPGLLWRPQPTRFDSFASDITTANSEASFEAIKSEDIASMYGGSAEGGSGMSISCDTPSLGEESPFWVGAISLDDYQDADGEEDEKERRLSGETIVQRAERVEAARATVYELHDPRSEEQTQTTFQQHIDSLASGSDRDRAQVQAPGAIPPRKSSLTHSSIPLPTQASQPEDPSLHTGPPGPSRPARRPRPTPYARSSSASRSRNRLDPLSAPLPAADEPVSVPMGGRQLSNDSNYSNASFEDDADGRSISERMVLRAGLRSQRGRKGR